MLWGERVDPLQKEADLDASRLLHLEGGTVVEGGDPLARRHKRSVTGLDDRVDDLYNFGFRGAGVPGWERIALLLRRGRGEGHYH